LDLDGFNGPVVITGTNTFSNLGVLYSSCAVATAMASAPTGTDNYPSYGSKTNY